MTQCERCGYSISASPREVERWEDEDEYGDKIVHRRFVHPDPAVCQAIEAIREAVSREFEAK